MMSDDNRAYVKGSEEESKLKSIAAQLYNGDYGKEAEELYNKYNPFKAKPFKNFISSSKSLYEKEEMQTEDLDLGHEDNEPHDLKSQLYCIGKSAMELYQMVDEFEGKGVLSSLVIDTVNDHNTQDTARRVAKMFIRETFSGRYRPVPKVTAFPNMGYKSLYTTGPISIRSTCAHHFQNIVGRCWVGIVPETEVIGLSKFNRIVHHICERPQIQEEMTTQIADALVNFAETPNIAVVIKAEHHCMTHRGVREHESDMTTAVMRGCFLEDKSIKNEFYQILNLKQK